MTSDPRVEVAAAALLAYEEDRVGQGEALLPTLRSWNDGDYRADGYQTM